MVGHTPASDISIKATRGLLWSMAENLGLQFVQFVFSILLARLLLPEQFGLIGMLTIFILLAQSLLDSGFGLALIQKKDASHLDACSVFYFNLLIGSMLTITLWLGAPLIARFYAQPLLTQLTRFLSPIIIINAFRLVPTAILTKQMDFRAIFKANLSAVIISGVVGTAMAFLGYGVWSLAAQSMLDLLIRMLFVWRISLWRPAWIFSIPSLKTMFSFGSRMLFSGLLDTFFNNIYQLFIGKVYSSADLGYYARAQGMHSMVVQTTGGALGRVIFPALVPIQDDKPRLKSAYRKIMTTAVFFHFPLIIGLAAVAQPLIILLMTDRWAPSIPYFQLFCLVGLAWPLHVLNLNILQVTGRSDLFFRLEIAKKLLIVLALIITFRFGITGLLYGQIASSIGSYILNSYYSGKLIGYSTAQQIRDVYPFLLMSVVMGILMYFVGDAVHPMFLKLVAQVGTGLALYFIASLFLGQSIIREVFRLFRNVLSVQSPI